VTTVTFSEIKTLAESAKQRRGLLGRGARERRRASALLVVARGKKKREWLAETWRLTLLWG